MSSQINTTGKNIALDAIGAVCTYMALYTDAAGTTEVTGGSPAYARKAITWNAASSGSKVTAASVTFDIPAGATIRAMGICTAITAGTQHAVDEPPTVETAVGQATYAVPSFTLNMT